MARRLDQMLVIDVESTCWEGDPPPGQISEIIEIGLCVVDVGKLERLEKRFILVRPARSQISEFCTRLTTLTAEHLKGAGTLADAIDILRGQYKSRERLWVSWGDYDRRQFERVCSAYELNYPFGISHMNLKSVYAVAAGLEREVGIDEATRRLGLPFEGTHHRGVDDAWNIAGVLCHLLGRLRSGGTVK